MSNEDGFATRRSILLIDHRYQDDEHTMAALNGLSGWTAVPSRHNTNGLVLQRAQTSIELRKLSDGIYQTVNVLPQDAEHRHVPVEQDLLSVLSHAVEHGLDGSFSVFWDLAEKDAIVTRD